MQSKYSGLREDDVRVGNWGQIPLCGLQRLTPRSRDTQAAGGQVSVAEVGGDEKHS